MWIAYFPDMCHVTRRIVSAVLDELQRCGFTEEDAQSAIVGECTLPYSFTFILTTSFRRQRQHRQGRVHRLARSALCFRCRFPCPHCCKRSHPLAPPERLPVKYAPRCGLCSITEESMSSCRLSFVQVPYQQKQCTRDGCSARCPQSRAELRRGCSASC